jgi:hypothetical protein
MNALFVRARCFTRRKVDIFRKINAFRIIRLRFFAEAFAEFQPQEKRRPEFNGS